jgi:hypothetical protein
MCWYKRGGGVVNVYDEEKRKEEETEKNLRGCIPWF